MRTRSSRGPVARGTDGAGADGTEAGAGAVFAGFSAFRASPLVIRPSLPVPAIEPASRAFSAITRLADGIGSLLAAGFTISGFASGAATDFALVAPLLVAPLLAAPLPAATLPGFRRAMTTPISAFSPSGTSISANTPSSGATSS